MKEVYLLSAKQISAQQPLSESWMETPERYEEPYIRAIDPDYKYFFPANVTRRLGKLLKRALLTSRQAMEERQAEQVDAIITATGLGCIENTELFLNALTREGEYCLKPTHFMQSTHNTIGSLIAISSKSQGYNSTYTHKGISFECALMDAFIQLKNEQIATALVGAHDEMTPDYFTQLKRIGYLGQSKEGFGSETAVSLLLGTAKEQARCRLRGIEMSYRPDAAGLQELFDRFLQQCGCELGEIDAVMLGVNGVAATDKIYEQSHQQLFPTLPRLHYKQLFGESYTAPALGFYAAATCLQQQRIPGHLFLDQGMQEQRGVRHILCYNQFENKNHTLILLSSCGD